MEPYNVIFTQDIADGREWRPPSVMPDSEGLSDGRREGAEGKTDPVMEMGEKSGGGRSGWRRLNPHRHARVLV
jgi:hypothetical protein